MDYDEESQRLLEAAARATAWHLGKVLAPVVSRLATDLEAFDLLACNAADCHRRSELESLLAAMQAYCEAAGSYNEQLLANLDVATATMQKEAASAAFFKRQFALTHADLQRANDRNNREFDIFQSLINRYKPAA